MNSFAPDGLASRKQDNLWTHYAFDPQGSVAQRTGASGAVVSSRTYDAYATYSVPASNVFQGGKDGWVIIRGGDGLVGRFKGLPSGMPPFVDLGPWVKRGEHIRR